MEDTPPKKALMDPQPCKTHHTLPPSPLRVIMVYDPLQLRVIEESTKESITSAQRNLKNFIVFVIM